MELAQVSLVGRPPAADDTVDEVIQLDGIRGGQLRDPMDQGRPGPVRGTLTEARQYARELFQKLRARTMTPVEAAEGLPARSATNCSNRPGSRSSDIGRAAAEQMKLTGKTLAQFQEHYAARMFQKAVRGPRPGGAEPGLPQDRGVLGAGRTRR